MTTEEREFWRGQVGRPCAVAYDPPDDRGVVVGVRVARTHAGNDKVTVRLTDGTRLAVWPRQVTVEPVPAGAT